LLPHDGSGANGFNARDHIALEYPRTDQISVWQLDGARVKAIEPYGFSGCGVWSRPISRNLAWQPSDLRLIANQYSWVDRVRAAGSVRCTRVSVAMGLIRKGVPEVAPSLDLVFPAARVVSPEDLRLLQSAPSLPPRKS